MPYSFQLMHEEIRKNKMDILQVIFSTLRKVSGSPGAPSTQNSEGFLYVNVLQRSAFIIEKSLLYLKYRAPF